jgi:hypothetical protein
MNSLCEKNNQLLPEVTCTFPHYNIVILVPVSLQGTKKGEKTSSCPGKEVFCGGPSHSGRRSGRFQDISWSYW